MEKISIADITRAAGDLYIVSGEGELPVSWDEYEGLRTVAAIKKRLRQERCGGDRWAYITDGDYRAE